MYVNSRLQVGQGCSALADGIVGRGSVTACRTGVVAAAGGTSGSGTGGEDGGASMRTGGVGAAEGGGELTTFFGISRVIRGGGGNTNRGVGFWLRSGRV